MERKQKKPSVLPLSSSSSMHSPSISISVCLPLSPSFLSIHFSLPLSLHTLLSPLPHWISFPRFIILSHFSQPSISPLSASSSSILQRSPLHSILSGLSECSVEIGSVTVSLETDGVGLPGVSTQLKSKAAVTSVKSAPI